MSRIIVAGSIGIAVVVIAPVYGQQGQTAAQAFANADSSYKSETLQKIVRHESRTESEATAEIISVALGDSSAAIRRAALAAVVSRAAAPRFDHSPAAVVDWNADHVHMRKLRPYVAAALRDPDDEVRRDAIMALVSLDFDVAAGGRMSAETERLLVERFNADQSAMVRAKIVGGFATDEQIPSRDVKKLLQSAFDDPNSLVRHAASDGAEKLDRDVALPLLIRQLVDTDQSVRAQGASVLVRYGPAAALYLPEIEAALQRERDPQVRFLLQRAIAAARRQP